MKRIKKRFFLIGIAVLLLGILTGLLMWENQALSVHTITVSDQTLPSSFDGFRIAQISDLHNTHFGNDHQKLCALLQTSEPDCIVVTGDLIDSYHPDPDTALSLMEKAVDIAPTYYVSGNHEARFAEYEPFCEKLQALGVTALSNDSVNLAKDGEEITLIGLEDPMMEADAGFADSEEILRPSLEKELETAAPYTILLAHHPEFLEFYAESGVRLVFSGHAHGGQVRLPFVGGVIAPGQGLFPRYDAGLYQLQNTQMIVSRGIGNSILPLRVNNPPELIVAVLKQSN